MCCVLCGVCCVLCACSVCTVYTTDKASAVSVFVGAGSKSGILTEKNRVFEFFVLFFRETVPNLRKWNFKFQFSVYRNFPGSILTVGEVPFGRKFHLLQSLFSYQSSHFIGKFLSCTCKTLRKVPLRKQPVLTSRNFSSSVLYSVTAHFLAITDTAEATNIHHV